jgi:hypothetical protein
MGSEIQWETIGSYEHRWDRINTRWPMVGWLKREATSSELWTTMKFVGVLLNHWQI